MPTLIVIGSRSRSERTPTVKYKRDLKALEQRRRRGMRMLARGAAQAEVARTLLEVEFGRVYSTTQVWRVLRGLGFSNQPPTGHAIQRR